MSILLLHFTKGLRVLCCLRHGTPEHAYSLPAKAPAAKMLLMSSLCSAYSSAAPGQPLFLCSVSSQ